MSELKKEKIEDLKEIKKEGRRLFFHFFDFETLKLRKKIRKNPKESIFLFLVTFILSSFITTFIFAFFLSSIHIKFALPEFNGFLPQKALISFSEPNNGFIDPYEVLLDLKNNKNSYILVDVRSKQEYQNGHISTAINIPGYESADNLTLSDTIKNQIKKLSDPLYSQNKPIILYAQTSYSNTPLRVAKVMGHTSQVVILRIGYNEWAHMKALWVPEAEWDRINPEDYVQK
jgi:rhodanese-related sulfurtransferase